MVNQKKRPGKREFRHLIERLESRELLSTLLEGLAANNLSGTTVAPLGNVFDDAGAGLVGDDFAISAPMARSGAGDVYVVFGGPHLDQPRTLDGCINPPTRVEKCSFIDSYLTSQRAVRILGARSGDEFGYAVAGVGNAIGDSRPDILIGAPFALNSGLVSSGRAYLIGGEVIAGAISAALAAGGTTVATIDLATIGGTATVRVFDGDAAGDQAGNSVAGLGSGNFIVGAPKNGTAPKEQRGAVYVFRDLRGLTGSGTLTPRSTLLGPSFGAHLGGVPAEELATTGFRGYGVSGIRNPALIPVADETVDDPRYSVLGDFDPDALVGAPDACVDDGCTTTDAARNGIAYLLSGTALLTLGGTYDLSSDADLKTLAAIPVQGAGNGDRLGASVGSAGDFDDDDVSDFMIAAPRRDIGGTTATLVDAGEIYLVFGREVNDTPFPNGVCHIDLVNATGPQENFRQCRDAAGLVAPLDAGDFIVPGTQVGLTLRGDATGEQAGVALGEARNVADPLGRSVVGLPGQVGVNEIIIGSPFRDLVGPGTFLQDAGRAYVLFGDSDYSSTSGAFATLSIFGPNGTGMIFEGRAANDNYGISVFGAGNAYDPIGENGDDILIGANHVDVQLLSTPAAPSPNVGETELLFGNITGGSVPTLLPSLLPFVQPGPFGPQIIAGGYWSWNNLQPQGADISRFPLCASQPQPIDPVEAPQYCIVQLPALPGQGDFLFPPYTVAMLPLGSTGPFVPVHSLTSTNFYPGADQPAKKKKKDHGKDLEATGLAALQKGKKGKRARLNAEKVDALLGLGFV